MSKIRQLDFCVFRQVLTPCLNHVCGCEARRIQQVQIPRTTALGIKSNKREFLHFMMANGKKQNEESWGCRKEVNFVHRSVDCSQSPIFP